MRAHVFARPAAVAIVEAARSGEPAVGQQEPVEPEVEEPEHDGPRAVAF